MGLARVLVAHSHANRGWALLHEGQRLFHVLGLMLACLGDLFERRRQVAILIQVPNDGEAGVTDRVPTDGQAQLPFQVVGE